MGQDWDASAVAWIAFVEQNASRTHLLDPVMLRWAGDLRGKTVLDVGCGEGRFSRMILAQGGRPIGVDPTLAFLRFARKTDASIPFLRGSAESLPLRDGVVDLAVSYISLIDIPDYRLAIREAARVLKPGGRFLIANLNAFMTTRERAWDKDEAGQSIQVSVDDYFDERPLNVSWCGIEVVNWHRPQGAYFEALLDAGLVLRTYVEPRPTAKAIAERPDLADSDRVPFFHVMVWEKP